MNRFALFAASMLIILEIGFQPQHAGSLSESIKAACVCVPARAGLFMKSMAKTQARSAQLLVSKATATQ
jgi:hypothetical protein